MLVSNIVIEIKILLTDQILDYFMCHPVFVMFHEQELPDPNTCHTHIFLD